MKKMNCSNTELLKHDFDTNEKLVSNSCLDSNKNQAHEVQSLLTKELKTLFPDWQKKFPFLKSFKNHSLISKKILQEIFQGNIPEEILVYTEFKNFISSSPYKKHILEKLQTCSLSPIFVDKMLKSLNQKLKRKERELKDIEDNINVSERFEVLREELIKIANFLSDSSKMILENVNVINEFTQFEIKSNLDLGKENKNGSNLAIDILTSITNLYNNFLVFRENLRVVYGTVNNLLQKVKSFENFYISFSDIELKQRFQELRLELDRIKQEIKFWEYIKRLHSLVNKKKLHLKKALMLNFVETRISHPETVLREKFEDKNIIIEGAGYTRVKDNLNRNKN